MEVRERTFQLCIERVCQQHSKTHRPDIKSLNLIHSLSQKKKTKKQKTDEGVLARCVWLDNSFGGSKSTPPTPGLIFHTVQVTRHRLHH